MISERCNSTVRAAQEAEVDDIIGISDVFDTEGLLSNTTFVAANLDALPKFGPEEINIDAVVDRQVCTESSLRDVSAAVQQRSMIYDQSDAIAIVDVTRQAVRSTVE